MYIDSNISIYMCTFIGYGVYIWYIYAAYSLLAISQYYIQEKNKRYTESGERKKKKNTLTVR